jgi:undecaprenyl-diphosphatase
LAVGASRLVLGVHWFSDVAFGLLVGIPWGIAVTILLAQTAWPFKWLSGGSPRTAARSNA